LERVLSHAPGVAERERVLRKEARQVGFRGDQFAIAELRLHGVKLFQRQLTVTVGVKAPQQLSHER